MISGIELDEAAFRDVAREIAERSDRAIDEVLTTYGRRTVELCIRGTPPFNYSARHTESGKTQRQVGEAAVEAGVRQGMQPWKDFLATKDRRKNRSLYAGISRCLRKGNIAKAEELRRRGLPKSRQFFLDASKELHDSHRWKGRVPKNQYPNLIVHGASIKKVVKEKQENVGFAKSGWLPAAIKMGSKLAGFAWLRGKGGESFGGISENQSPGRQEITIWNGVPYIQESGAELRIIQDALDSVSRNMKREALILAMKGYYRGWRKGQARMIGGPE